MDSNVKIVVNTSEPTSTSTPHTSPHFDADFLIGDEPEPIDDY